jgi:hypothetical protein
MATAAAAGVLLTATGTAGSLCYAAWAGIDGVLGRRIAARPAVRRGLGNTGRLVGGLPGLHRRQVELAYFGGLTFNEIRRLVWMPMPATA